MDTVAFINVQTTSKRDLILSFAIRDEKWTAGIRSLILLRSPAFEHVFDESERGIAVSMEGLDDGSGDPAGKLLTELTSNASDRTVRMSTARHTFALDVRQVDAGSLQKMSEVLKKMNFDGKSKIVELP